MRSVYNIRLNSTSTLTNAYLIYSWLIPEPDLMIYRTHSQRVPLTDGGQALRGFDSFALTWNRLTYAQAYKLREIVQAALDTANQDIYATIDRNWSGVGFREDWIDVNGRPIMPEFNPVSGQSGLSFNDVTLRVNNLTIDNDPASF